MRTLALLPLVVVLGCVGDSVVPSDGGSDVIDGSSADVTTDTTTSDVDAGAARTGDFQWLYQLKDVGTFGLAVGPDGSTSIATTFSGTITVEGVQISAATGGSDLLVLQLDAKGKVKWYKHYGAVNTDIDVGGVSVSGNTVIVAGYFLVHATSGFTWSPIPNYSVTTDGEENPGPFILGFDATQGGTMTWARSVVMPNAGEGYCKTVSSSVAGEVAVGCWASGSLYIPAQNTPVMLSTVQAAVIDVIHASDGYSTDSEVIEGLNGTIALGLDADLNAYASLDALTSPIKFRRANTSVAFDASSIHNLVVRLQGGGGPLWTSFWPSTLSNPAPIPRIAFDSAKNPWIGFTYMGMVDPGGGPMTSAGQTDWAVAQLGRADGKVVAQKSFGGVASDGVFDLGFDGEDLVIYGEGKSFPIGSLAVPSSPGSSTELVLAKMDKASLVTGAWVQTATETVANVDWSTTKMGIGGGLEVIGGATTTEVDFTTTATVSGTGVNPALFVAAYAR